MRKQEFNKNWALDMKTEYDKTSLLFQPENVDTIFQKNSKTHFLSHFELSQNKQKTKQNKKHKV